MRAVALVLSASVLATGCFPKEPQKRLYAQLTEGTFLVGGIAMLTVAGTGANCDLNKMAGQVTAMGCKEHEGTIGTIGLGLIILGLVGFIATVSSAEDDDKPTPVIITPPPAPIVTAPPPPATSSGSGSAAPGTP